MSRYPCSSSGFTDDDASSGTSSSEDWAHNEEPPDQIFDEYTDTNLEWQVPCTAAEHRTCQIVDHLPALNKLLCSIGLRLRELSYGDGQLALVKTLTPLFIPLREQVKQEQVRNFECLAWLLKSHSCVTSMYVDCRLLCKFKECNPYDLFECNTTLKSLKVDSRAGMYSLDVRRIIPEVAQLEKLEMLIGVTYADKLKAVSEALRTKNLSALKVFSDGCLSDEGSEAFMSALKASSTLRELSVDSRLFKCTDPRETTAFTEFLENNSVLDSLNIYGHDLIFTECVLTGMRRNRSVSKLYFFGLYCDSGLYLLLRDLLLENAVLKSLTLSTMGYDYTLSREGFEEWFEALGKNEGLRYIRFPFAMVPHDRWYPLFETVSTHKSLKEVVVDVSGWQYIDSFVPHPLPNGLDGTLPDVCKILESSGAKHKVTFTFAGLGTPSSRRRLYNWILFCTNDKSIDGFNKAVLLLRKLPHDRTESRAIALGRTFIGCLPIHKGNDYVEAVVSEC
ncbi:hypothetical protein MTO96_036758 [Rhipicephalus appendiculatus]